MVPISAQVSEAKYPFLAQRAHGIAWLMSIDMNTLFPWQGDLIHSITGLQCSLNHAQAGMLLPQTQSMLQSTLKMTQLGHYPTSDPGPV